MAGLVVEAGELLVDDGLAASSFLLKRSDVHDWSQSAASLRRADRRLGDELARLARVSPRPA